MQQLGTEIHCQNPECGKLFYLHKMGSRFCSRVCADIGNRNRVGMRYCFVCGSNKTFLRHREGKHPSWFTPFNISTMTIYFCRKCRNKFLYQHRRRITRPPKKADLNGAKNPFYGKRHTPEMKKHISESSKGRNVGRKASPEEIAKIRQARAKQILPVKDTSIEKTIQRELTQRGIKFEPHKRFWIRGFSHAVDIYIRPDLCIECDGHYWHTKLIPHNNRNCKMSPLYRDYLIDTELEDKGIRVIRLSDDSIQNNLSWCIQLITKVLTIIQKLHPRSRKTPAESDGGH